MFTTTLESRILYVVSAAYRLSLAGYIGYHLQVLLANICRVYWLYK